MGNAIKPKLACREVVAAEQISQTNDKLGSCPSQCPPTTLPERRCARRGRPERLRKTTNPFLIFFLRLKSRQPHVRVSKLARIAGERWQCMTCEERKKYVDLAEAEKRRRQSRRCMRKVDRNRSKGSCKRKRGSKRRGEGKNVDSM